MQEVLRVFAYPAKGHERVYQAWLKSLESRGLRVDRERWRKLHAGVDVFIRPDNPGELEPFEIAKASGFLDEFQPGVVEQIYERGEFETAPMFSFVHVGRCIEFARGRDNRAGICHFVDFDANDACATCGAHAEQSGPLRLLTSELNKAGKWASLAIIANDFHLITQSLLDQLQDECRELLPVREVVQIGKSKPKERWWQLDPTHVMPTEFTRCIGYGVTRCKRCDAAQLRSEGKHVRQMSFTVKSEAFSTSRTPALVLSPFWTVDHILRFDDGRLKSVPSRRIWLRGDLGRAILKLKIRGLQLTPILPK